MATTNGDTRTYDIATETLNGAAATKKLIAEIEAEALVTGTLDRIDKKGGDMNIIFTAAIPAGDEAPLDAVVAAHDGVKGTGKFKFAENNSVQSTTLQTYQTALAFTTPPMTEGQYLIHWQCEVRVVPSGPLNSAASLRFRAVGSNKGLGHWPHDDWTTIGGIDRQRLDEGEEALLEIQYRRDPNVGGNDTIEIRRVKLGLALLNE